jgi:hypothetical protein
MAAAPRRAEHVAWWHAHRRCANDPTVDSTSLVDRCGKLLARVPSMIRKIASGYRLYSRKKDPKTGQRRNLGTFSTRTAAEKHERAVQYFKHH